MLMTTPEKMDDTVLAVMRDYEMCLDDLPPGADRVYEILREFTINNVVDLNCPVCELPGQQADYVRNFINYCEFLKTLSPSVTSDPSITG
jgi:hypothetical protein